MWTDGKHGDVDPEKCMCRRSAGGAGQRGRGQEAGRGAGAERPRCREKPPGHWPKPLPERTPAPSETASAAARSPGPPPGPAPCASATGGTGATAWSESPQGARAWRCLPAARRLRRHQQVLLLVQRQRALPKERLRRKGSEERVGHWEWMRSCRGRVSGLTGGGGPARVRHATDRAQAGAAGEGLI